VLLRWQFVVLTVLGALALALVLLNAGLAIANRDAQAALSQRQLYVQQSVTLEALYRDIVKALAELAVKGNDAQLIAVLGAQGLSVKVGEPAGPTASGGSTPARKPEKSK
jgi:hypothetical protein